MSKTVLFVHQNYPAQFGNIAGEMVRQGWTVFYATAKEGVTRHRVRVLDDGVNLIGYERHRENTEGVHTYVKSFEQSVLNAQGFAQLAVKMNASNVVPDIIVAHSGWGSGGFCKTIWPDAKYVQYLEWWYTYPSRDLPEEADERTAPHKRADTIGRNMNFLFDFISADAVWMPTHFQALDIPDYMRAKTRIAFDGVDTDFFEPRPLPDEMAFNSISVSKDQLLLTYATRGMEPQRGFPEFMEALSILQKRRGDFHTVIAGEPTIHYSAKLEDDKTYKDLMLEKFEFDHERLHFCGRLAFPDYRNLLLRSNAHVYLTRPFVTSWSFFESAAAAAPIIASDAENTREVLPKDSMAKYVDYKNIDALVDAMDYVLDHPDEAKTMGENARKQIVKNYARKDLYPAHIQFFEDVIDGKFPPQQSRAGAAKTKKK